MIDSRIAIISKPAVIPNEVRNRRRPGRETWSFLAPLGMTMVLGCSTASRSRNERHPPLGHGTRRRSRRPAHRRVRARTSRRSRPRTADPVERRAREAAHRLRRRSDARHRDARQHLGAGVRRARRARAARLATLLDRRGYRRPISSPAIWNTNVVERTRRTAFRGTSTRG